MHKNGQGLAATLFMFAPLLAVPFIAVWSAPWLAANAKLGADGSQEVEDAELADWDPGVGNSQTRRHSSDDLFSPVTTEAVVDLEQDDELVSFPARPPAAQNPHLRNASLVVAHNEGWVDPFDEIPARSSHSPRSARQFANANGAAPMQPMENEAPRAFPEEAPAPHVFEEPVAPAIPPASVNPFEAEPPEVAVDAEAFAAPPSRDVADPRVSSNDSARTLFEPPMPEESRPVAMAPKSVPQPEAAKTPTKTAKSEMTFDLARDRLKQFGITHFYLEPNAENDTYHFRCLYRDQSQSRVNRLFEAEAKDPLAAVEEVLEQIEEFAGGSQ